MRAGASARRARVAAATILIAALAGCAEPPAEESQGKAVSADSLGLPGVPDSSFVGQWGALLPAADSPGRKLSLALNGSGAAILTLDFQNGKPPLGETGGWQGLGDGHARVSLSRRGGAPDTMVLALRGADLVAVAYDTLAWGRAGFTLARVPE